MCKAPIIQHFAESLSGSTTIRSFEQKARFVETNFQLNDQYSGPKFYNAAAMEWLCLRLDALATATFAFCLIFLVSIPVGTISPGKPFHDFSTVGLCSFFSSSFSSSSCSHRRGSRELWAESEYAPVLGHLEPLQPRKQDNICGEDTPVHVDSERAAADHRIQPSRLQLAFQRGTGIPRITGESLSDH